MNRGLAILGDRLFMATVDAKLIALDAKSGRVLWKTAQADYETGYAGTVAPLVVKDKVIVGIAGAEYGIRGFVDAYDAATGKRVWRFYTFPVRATLISAPGKAIPGRPAADRRGPRALTIRT